MQQEQIIAQIITQIIELLRNCSDEDLLDLILKLLIESSN